jgi:Regulatory P domain of the subtilisin-like proprotein convertases and other proteases
MFAGGARILHLAYLVPGFTKPLPQNNRPFTDQKPPNKQILRIKIYPKRNFVLMLSLFYSRPTSVFLLPALLIAAFVSAFPALLSGQGCGCTNCPQFMPDNFVGSFTINVTGADNPTLGQNGQGVCGVNIHFDHEYLGDLRITLTSPSGQTVTLIGPIGFFGPTDGSSWNISFVPCNGNPDPDPGFSAQWNNNQNWGLNGTFTGSYFPQQGCLENFNSGPVDGTWTLTVTDGQANDVGNFYDYEIIFL